MTAAPRRLRITRRWAKTSGPRSAARAHLAAWLACLALASPEAAWAAPPEPGAPNSAGVEARAARLVRDAATLTAAVEPWTDALERAREALEATPVPALDAAAQALSRGREARDAATPRLTAAAASFRALARAVNARRVFPPPALAAASAFRGAAGAYHDREARQARLEQALAQARAATTPPAPAPNREGASRETSR